MIPISVDTYPTHTNRDITSSDEESRPPSIQNSTNPEIELIFLGTGTSSSIPHLDCLTAPPDKKPCKTCLSTLTPEGRRNIRRNTSAVVRVTAGKDGKKTTLVIDVGKNFQAAAVEWFPKYGLREIDAVLITHAHADAMNGLDDLRGDYHFPCLPGSISYRLPHKTCWNPTGWTLGSAIQEHIDVYVSQGTFREVKRAFPYLVAKEFASGGGDVPDFKWHIIEDKVPFEIKDTGVRITPFSVHHGRLFTASSPPGLTPTPFAAQPTTPMSGGSSPTRRSADDGPKVQPYLCFGFLVQGGIAYMSDVSLIPDDAWSIIQAGGQKAVLVIDCLRLRGHMSHMGMREAAAAIRKMGARRSYMTGFNHDVSQEEYVRIGEGESEGGDLSCAEREGIEMMREGLEGEVHWVRPAHDGLRVVLCPDGRVWDETYT